MRWIDSRIGKRSLIVIGVVSVSLAGVGARAAEYKTVEELRVSAEADDTTAQFQLGERYYYGQQVRLDRAIAMSWYKKAANAGHAEASWKLFKMLDSGVGIRSDITASMEWLGKAAKNGHTEARVTLGLRYTHGRGVPKSDRTAAILYEAAANQGDVRAQGMIGGAYYAGKGVQRNFVKAYKWFKLSAEGRDYRAIKLLKIVEESLDESGMKAGDALIAEYRAKRANLSARADAP